MNPKILMNLPCQHLYIQGIWQMVRYRSFQHHFRDRWRFQIWFSGYHFCLCPFCNILGIGLRCNIPRMTRCLCRREKMLHRYLRQRYQVDSNRSLCWHERRDTVCHLWIQSLSRKNFWNLRKIVLKHKVRGVRNFSRYSKKICHVMAHSRNWNFSAFSIQSNALKTVCTFSFGTWSPISSSFDRKYIDPSMITCQTEILVHFKWIENYLLLSNSLKCRTLPSHTIMTVSIPSCI